MVVHGAHVDEPFVDQTEEQRSPAPPAVRVAVGIRLQVIEEAASLQVVHDSLGDVGCLEPAQPAEAVVIQALLVDRSHHR